MDDKDELEYTPPPPGEEDDTLIEYDEKKDNNQSRRQRAIRDAQAQTDQAIELARKARSHLNQLAVPEEQAQHTDDAWTHLDTALANLTLVRRALRKASRKP